MFEEVHSKLILKLNDMFRFKFDMYSLGQKNLPIVPCLSSTSLSVLSCIIRKAEEFYPLRNIYDVNGILHDCNLNAFKKELILNSIYCTQ